MKYVVQEYTSVVDGKVRFRVISTKRCDEIFEVNLGTTTAFLMGHFHGLHESWDRE
mgnify:CR=1 FL=1